jgi:group II intron reverse transcriptase/maturase
MSTNPFNNKVVKRKKLRHNEYYDMQETFDSLYEKSKNGKTFINLMELITSKDNIVLAYRNLKSNSGSKTPGIDGFNIEYFKNKSNEELIKIVRNKLRNYHPKGVRRVLIPKKNGKFRPLGIPTIVERLIQQCILQILEPICEAKFYKHSYGFRPLRSTHDAMSRAFHLAQQNNLHYVIDIDIEGFFDNINHGKLLKQIWALGIQDKHLISVISRMLKAKIENIGIPTKGTPQGGIISPLLSNIALNELDWWIVSQWENMPTRHNYKPIQRKDGSFNNGNKFSALKKSNLKEIYIVRYADDFKIFCKSNEQANRAYIATTSWLKERLHLDVSKEKSGIVNLKKRYSEFLGFKFKVTVNGKTTHKDARNQKLKWTQNSHISDSNAKKIVSEVKEKIEAILNAQGHATANKIRSYNSFVFGLHSYFNVATDCSKDFSEIAYKCRSNFDKLKSRKVRIGDEIPRYIKDYYGKSKRLVMVHEMPLIPISFVTNKFQNGASQLSPYIKEDREKIHNELKIVRKEDIKYLIDNPVLSKSVEYNDNRISRFIVQQGKDFVTGRKLDIHEMHCHHRNPTQFGGNDSYDNLVLVLPDIHRLIHANTKETVNKYLQILNLNERHLESVNRLRTQAQLPIVKI